MSIRYMSRICHENFENQEGILVQMYRMNVLCRVRVLHLLSIRLESHVQYRTHIFIQCGTEVKENSTHIVYKNKIVSDHKFYTKDRRFGINIAPKLDFTIRCSIPRLGKAHAAIKDQEHIIFCNSYLFCEHGLFSVTIYMKSLANKNISRSLSHILHFTTVIPVLPEPS